MIIKIDKEEVVSMNYFQFILNGVNVNVSFRFIILLPDAYWKSLLSIALESLQLSPALEARKASPMRHGFEAAGSFHPLFSSSRRHRHASSLNS